MSFDQGNRWTARATMPQVGIDVGLRDYMLKVYNFMAGGLAITGVVAYVAAASGFYQAIFGTALYWVVMFAPLGLVLLLSFRIQKMSLGAAQLTFWAYAASSDCPRRHLHRLYRHQHRARPSSSPPRPSWR